MYNYTMQNLSQPVKINNGGWVDTGQINWFH
jgi:hypothetical protein